MGEKNIAKILIVCGSHDMEKTSGLFGVIGGNIAASALLGQAGKGAVGAFKSLIKNNGPVKSVAQQAVEAWKAHKVTNPASAFGNTAGSVFNALSKNQGFKNQLYAGAGQAAKAAVALGGYSALEHWRQNADAIKLQKEMQKNYNNQNRQNYGYGPQMPIRNGYNGQSSYPAYGY